jgi:hypothetical protein
MQIVTWIQAHAGQIVDVLAQVFFCVVIVATLISKLLGKKFDWVDNSESKVVKILQWLPTIGIHPSYETVKQAYDELQEEKVVAEGKQDGDDKAAS